MFDVSKKSFVPRDKFTTEIFKVYNDSNQNEDAQHPSSLDNKYYADLDNTSASNTDFFDIA